MNTREIYQPYTLLGPASLMTHPALRLVLDPLAIILLDNRLCMFFGFHYGPNNFSFYCVLLLMRVCHFIKGAPSPNQMLKNVSLNQLNSLKNMYCQPQVSFYHLIKVISQFFIKGIS